MSFGLFILCQRWKEFSTKTLAIITILLRLNHIDNLAGKLRRQINIRTHIVAEAHIFIVITIDLIFFSLIFQGFHIYCGSNLLLYHSLQSIMATSYDTSQCFYLYTFNFIRYYLFRQMQKEKIRKKK